MTPAVAVATMKAARVTTAGADLSIVELEVPTPGPGQVRIKVRACGVCHSDAIIVEGRRPGIVYPRVPGHEVAGVVDLLGTGVTEWREGQRVGVGWHGGHDGTCLECRRGDFRLCRNEKNPGLSYDGGYQEYMLAPVDALVSIPDGLSDVDAAPMVCAGSNTFNALRYAGALPGDLVAVQGIGGLGHLGIQFARQLGFHTVAIGRGKDKEDLARQLGAHRYIDSEASDAAKELEKMGGARIVLATAPSSKAMSEIFPGIAAGGALLVVGASMEPISVSPAQLLLTRRSILGWPSGTSRDSQDTLQFAALSGVRPMIETFPLAKAAEAYDRMITGKVRFRAVLIP